MSNINKIFFSFVVLLLAFSFFSMDASADREQIATAKQKIDQLRDDSEILDDKILKQKELIDYTTKKLDDLKDKLRDLKRDNDDTWESIQNILDAENEIADAKKILDSHQKQLQSFLDEKSNSVKLLQTLQKDLKILESKLRATVSESQMIQNENKDSKSFNFTGYVKNIGVALSSSCITMIQNNYTTTCPTYDELYQLDSSNQEVSGKFGYKDGIFQRLEPKTQNHWRWYDTDNILRLFVDPSDQNRMKTIEIVPNLETYTIKGKNYQSQKFENTTIHISNGNQTKAVSIMSQTQDAGRIIYHDRYVDEYCKTAMINSDKWKELLPDTIHHMRKNCDGNTTASDMEFIPANNTEFNREESPSWQELQWFEKAKAKCKELCFLQ